MRKYVGWEGRRRRRRDVRRSVANEFDCMPNGRRCQSASEAAAWETTLRRNEITPLRFLPRRLRVCPIFWKEPSFPSSSLPPFPYSQPCLVPHERPNHIYSLRLAVHVLARVYTWVTLIPRNFRRTNGCRGLRQFVHWDEKQVPTLLSSRGCSRLYPFDAFLRSCFSPSCTLTFTLDGDERFRSGDSLDDSLDFYIQLRSSIETLSKLLNPIVPSLENDHVTPFVQIGSYGERKRNVCFICSNSTSKIDEATTSLSLDYACNCLCL